MMNKNFRFVLVLIMSGILLFSCLKKSGKKEVEEDLKTAMGQYLNHQPRLDTSRIKFKVLEVTYYEDKKAYLCEFKVNMKQKENNQIKDTVGVMAANISKDFKTVSRKY